MKNKNIAMGKQKIVQKRLWKEKEFRLDDGILHLKEMGLFSGYETELRYEDIIGEKRIKRKPNFFLLVAAAFLMYLSSVNIFDFFSGQSSGIIIPALGMLMAIILFYVVYRGAQEILYLDTVHSVSIGFFRDEACQKRADEFIAELLKQRKDFLVKKYWDCVDCYEQKMHNLDWLKNMNIVNINEFKHLKDEMLRVEAEKSLIGYHNKDSF